MSSKQVNCKALFGIALLMGAVLVITGCGDNAVYHSSVATPNPPPQVVEVVTSAPAQEGQSGGPALQQPGGAQPVPTSQVAQNATPDSGSAAVSYTQQQRVVLKNATLTLTVENPAQTVTQVTQLVEGIGGWVVSSNTVGGMQNGIQLIQGTISVRVPADKFVTVLQSIRAGAISVDAETITGDDVTQKYVDLNSQLTNLQSTEAQLQKIMSTATNVNDVLSVQAKLTDVQGQIEQIKGQLNYYSQAAAYSLIALTLNQKLPPATPTMTPTITPTPTPTDIPTAVPLGIGNWHPGDTAREAISTLVGLTQSLITLAIWLLIIGLPFAIIILIGYLVWRRLQPVPPKRKPSG
ncbi:MAG: DUF4349 domain-containing protein [Aggregatilineales bacterium]